MILLLSNDDGIYAPGLRALAESLQDLGQLYIVAPSQECSATGHGITVHRPLRLETVTLPGINAKAWSVDGTPADCIKLAVEDLLSFPPDIVVAGINHGPNLGTDVLYSGTVSAAIEGAINGFTSLAISLASDTSTDFSIAAQVARKIIFRLFEKSLPKGTLLNINVPEGKPRGVRITKLGTRRYVNVFDKRIDPRGRVYYWMAGEPLDLVDNENDTDILAVKEKFISITPLQLDLTNYQTLPVLKRYWEEAL